MATKVKLLQDRFTRTVEQGYQAALTWHQGWPKLLVHMLCSTNQLLLCTKSIKASCRHHQQTRWPRLALINQARQSCTAVYQDGFVMYAGSLESDDSSAAGHLPPTVKSVKWAYSTRPIYGWGDTGADQKSTAGWLAAMPVFEPHWQVCFLPVTISSMATIHSCCPDIYWHTIMVVNYKMVFADFSVPS